MKRAPSAPRPPAALRWLWLAVVMTGCLPPTQVKLTYDQADAALVEARAVYASACTPELMARAEAARAFAEIDTRQGDLKRGASELRTALELARTASIEARPCGTADADKDRLPDVVDRCPAEAEDYDGDRDDDGCRDVDPYGDEDGDSIRNIDDDCPFTAEDFDSDRDDDGCPEQSDDVDGDGIVDTVDQCPGEAEDLDGFLDSDGCPDNDNDDDGIVDKLDGCSKVPEDLDGWDDDDGCPDPDNDGDGVPDNFDACPTAPGDRALNGCPADDSDQDGVADTLDRCPGQLETKNAYLDEDGCPDTPPERVSVTSTRVRIHETIQFQTGRATLLPTSAAVLDDVRKVLLDAPGMRLRIEGHTDNEGTDDVNYTLSRERAESVKVYLTSAGIAPERLEVVGYGETRPVDTNRTAAGRSRNRRVEFVILDSQGQPVGAAPSP
jgi:outer membrane protein OmpA-like peptidoglycan-associated protein